MPPAKIVDDTVMQGSIEERDQKADLTKLVSDHTSKKHALETVTASYFPKISHANTSSSIKRHLAKITLDRAINPTANSTKHAKNGSHEVLAAWGLILHLYTRETAISFGCTTDDEAREGLGIKDKSTCQLDVQPDMLPHDIFRSIKLSDRSCPGIQDYCAKPEIPVAHPYNTAIHIHDPHVRNNQTPPNADEFDLVLMVSSRIEVLEVALSFRASFLSDKGASNVLHTFGRAAEVLSLHPYTFVRDMNLLSDWNVQQIMQWNDHLPKPEPSCVHTLIEQHVRSQPEAASVHAWDGTLTYMRLDVLASKLAKYLVSIGTDVEDFVPLCFEKSMWAVVSLLAVLKAGAACAFIEPSHPMERIRCVLQTMDAKVILCSPTSSRIFKSQPGAITNIIEVDEVFIDYIEIPSHLSLPVVQPHNAAILLFTSGSTGQPKGIVQEHSTAAFSAENYGAFLGITKGSRSLQWAAYCFDMSVIDILTALIPGACICIPSETDRMENLPKVMRDMDVDNAALTPSFAQTIKSAYLPKLKTLIFGGEPVSRDDLIGWSKYVRIINGCGPAEASVCIAGEASLECPAKIGRAIGSVAWIVDENDYTRLAPIGVVGELLIEGPLLARGYLKDPEKTSESFIKYPPWLVQLRKSNGLRLYRTGDLARWDTDGTIEFVARKDSQVKLRGQRIEAGEIEHHLRKCLPAGISVQVSIITPSGQTQSPRLAAFIGVGYTLHNESSQALTNLSMKEKGCLIPLLTGLEERLSYSLPAYMVPSYYIPLRYIPLTISGKTNRKLLGEVGSSLSISEILELSKIHHSDAVSDHNHKNKAKSLEEQMSELWKKILHCEDQIISPEDNFFKLGGDSINAMQLVKAAKDIGIGLDTTQVFQHPTVTGMSVVASRINSGSKVTPAPELEDSGEMARMSVLPEDVFCPSFDSKQDAIEDIVDAPDMQAFMVVYGLLKSRGYINYFAFDLTGRIDSVRLEHACRSLVQRHSALRTIFGLRAGRVLQIVLKSMSVEFVRTSGCQSTEILLAKFCEANKACHAQLGDKIVRFVLVSRGPHDHVLIMRMSHAQFDGTSLSLIYRDLRLAYQGADLPAAPNFVDVTRAMQQANTDEAETFWRRLLDKSSMTSVVQHTKTCYANIINDRVTTSFPWQSTHCHGMTLATVVKAAWAIVLAELSSLTDVVFAYAVTGRNLPMGGIDRVVGDCNNPALTRVQLARHKTVLDLLKDIQEQYLAMIPYETMGIRQVVEKCTDWPRWTRYCTGVNHQNYEDAGLDAFRMGEAECRVSYKDSEADRRDIQVYSWPPKDGRMRIDMAFCNHAIRSEVVETILGRLTSTMQHIASQPQAPLVLSSSAPCSSLRKLPMIAENANAVSPVVPPQPRPLSFRFGLFDAEPIVARVWSKFLATANLTFRNDLIVTMDTPFYDIGGDMVYAAQLSTYYHQEGIEFTMEDLIEHPTKRLQIGIIQHLI